MQGGMKGWRTGVGTGVTIVGGWEEQYWVDGSGWTWVGTDGDADWL